jgi:hypothetical protein
VLCLRRALPWSDAKAALQSLGAGDWLAPPRIAEIRRRTIIEGFRLTPSQFEHLSRLAKKGLVPPEIEPIVTGHASAAAR